MLHMYNIHTFLFTHKKILHLIISASVVCLYYMDHIFDINCQYNAVNQTGKLILVLKLFIFQFQEHMTSNIVA